jgi:putative membrane protein insertion efficiency factor
MKKNNKQKSNFFFNLLRLKSWFIHNLKELFILPIKLYQLVLSPFFGRNCIYHPSCSNYGIEAIRKKGIFKGILLTAWRILRCNPWSKGGNDPV